jgi:peptide/nickel transport system substrate-binding protein
MDLKKHTRRDFLRLTGLTAAGVAVAACVREPEVVEKIVKETVVVEKEVEKEVTTVVEKEVEKEVTVVVEKEVAPPTSKYNEAPMLAARVARGELPPVDERLPEDVRVCPVYEQIGEYGGTAALCSLSMNLFGGDAAQGRFQDTDHLLRISSDGREASPNVLRHWEMSDDFKEVTCYMRKGMKWSDGHPLTTEDFRYGYEDMLFNTEITPVPHISLRWGGEPMKLTIIDDYTFKLSFAQPHPSFVLVNMAHRYGFGQGHFVPAHYLKQFHIKYNDKANDLAKQAGFDFWYQLHGRANNRAQDVDRPRLETFVPVRDTPAMSFLERNPYYSAVDPEGNQLPYIDRITHDKCSDLSVMDAKVVGGSYDFACYELRIIYYATYAEGAAASDAYMKTWPTGKGGECVYNVNMNYVDDEWREVFSDDRFRQALSLAINRADINNIVYFGNASESQYTVIPASRHYKPEYAQAYAEYDPDRANALLDEMGLEWNAAHTHRLWPVSKQPIIITWDLVEIETPKGPITEIVAENWMAIGIETPWKSITRTLLTQRILANENPMSAWHGDETIDTLFLRRPKFFAPIDGDESCWGVLWGRWYYTGGAQGEEPPAIIKQLYDWLDEYMLTDSDEPARKSLESQAEHVWTIGAIGNGPHPMFVRNNLKNISDGGYWTWDTYWAFTEYPEQWFFEQ